VAADIADNPDDWTWLNQALFGVDAGFAPAARRLRARSGSWAVLPNATAPRRLVPADRAAAAASFANVHDAMSANRLRAGRLTQRLVGMGAPLSMSGSTALPASVGLGGDRANSVLADLAGRLGVGARGSVAITLGPRRYNRKPVVQLIDERGTTRAFVKIACNDVTDRFVATEAAWLERAGSPGGDDGFGVLRPPEVLGDWEWHGRRVLAVAPIHPTAHRPELLDADRLQALATDIASIGPTVQATLAEAECVGRVRAVAEAVGDDRLVHTADVVVDHWGDQTLALAPWHGDLTPWNTITSPGHTALLDWEFAADAMPIGADLIHHHVMVDTHLNGVAITAALRSVRSRIPALLRGFANENATDPTLALYLLELARRDAHLVSHEAPTTGFGQAALDLLDEISAT